MSEYIIEWFGIGEQLTRLREGNVPFVLWPKRIREERRREEIVRCRDCVAYEPYHTYAGMKLDYGECMQHRRQTNDERFCWWGKRSDR